MVNATCSDTAKSSSSRSYQSMEKLRRYNTETFVACFLYSYYRLTIVHQTTGFFLLP